MKALNIFLKLSLLSVVFLACTKKENKVFFEGGTPPVLTSTASGTIVLEKDKKEEVALVLSWTNPNYMFNTGVSSQNVYYIVQIDTAGKNFTSPKLQEMSIASDLSVSLSVQELNVFLSKMEFTPGVEQSIDIRIKATLLNGTVPTYSNTLTLKVNPYLDFAVEPPGTPDNNYEDGELWVVGDAFASGWSNPLPSPYDVTQRFTRIDIMHYELVVEMAGGGAYKIIQKQGDWSTQYHALDGGTWEGGAFEKRDADPGFPGAPTAGTYKITINFQTGRYAVVRQ